MAKRPNKIDIITWVLLIIVLISNIFTLYTAIATREDMPIKVKQVVDSSIEKVDYTKINYNIDKIVSQKVNSLNITQPKDGKDSISTIEKTTETLIKEIPIKGDTGIQGNTGASAYDIAIKNGFLGSEKDWLSSLKGNDGLPPILRCNATKGRLEYRYSEFETWKAISGQPECVVK